MLSAEVAWKILSILANEISVRQFLDLSFQLALKIQTERTYFRFKIEIIWKKDDLLHGELLRQKVAIHSIYVWRL